MRRSWRRRRRWTERRGRRVGPDETGQRLALEIGHRHVAVAERHIPEGVADVHVPAHPVHRHGLAGTPGPHRGLGAGRSRAQPKAGRRNAGRQRAPTSVRFAASVFISRPFGLVLLGQVDPAGTATDPNNRRDIVGRGGSDRWSRGLLQLWPQQEHTLGLQPAAQPPTDTHRRMAQRVNPAALAQLVERRPCKANVESSSLSRGSVFLSVSLANVVVCR